MLKRRKAEEADARGNGRARDTRMEGEFPVLAQYLTETNYDDGSERQTSTLLLFAEEGIWKACLNDRQEGCSLWMTGSTLQEAFEALETVLANGSGAWRAHKPYSKSKR